MNCITRKKQPTKNVCVSKILFVFKFQWIFFAEISFSQSSLLASSLECLMFNLHDDFSFSRPNNISTATENLIFSSPIFDTNYTTRPAHVDFDRDGPLEKIFTSRESEMTIKMFMSGSLDQRLISEKNSNSLRVALVTVSEHFIILLQTFAQWRTI